MINLSNLIMAIAVIVLTVVCGLLLYSFVRLRRSAPNDTELEQCMDNNPILETIWAIIPVGILIILLILTCQAL